MKIWGKWIWEKPEKRIVVEVATDRNGNLLWAESYVFGGLSLPGSTFIRNSNSYSVISSYLRNGIVFTVVK